MAFSLYTTDKAYNPPYEYLPCSAIIPKAGMMMTTTAGKLAIASGTTKPTYVCDRDESVAVAAGTVIPVCRVNPDMIFSTKNNASFSSINIGDKVTLHTDGLQVTATTTNGVAEVVYISAAAAAGSGGEVLVRFPG